MKKSTMQELSIEKELAPGIASAGFDREKE